MKKLLVFGMVQFVMLQGCKVKVDVEELTVQQNQQIAAEFRTTAHREVEEVYAAIVAGDEAKLRTHFSEGLDAQMSPVTLQDLLNTIRPKFKNLPFHVIDEYYVQGATIGKSVELSNNAPDPQGYTLSFSPRSTTNYVALLNTENQFQGWATLMVFGVEEDEFELNVLRFGMITLYEKNAPDFFTLGLRLRDDSCLVDAVAQMEGMRAVLSPLEQYLTYNSEMDMTAFEKSLKADFHAQHPNPLQFERIGTHPEVFEIVGERSPQGFVPLFNYITTVKREDSLALDRENKQLQSEIGKRFPCIKANNPAIFYRAYQELPSQGKTTPYFGFVEFLDTTSRR